MNTPIQLLIFLQLLSICSFAQSTHTGYRIVSKIHLEGDGGWDYLTMDDSTNRLYISHGTIVQVLDIREKKVTGYNPDGILYDPFSHKVFTFNGKSSNSTVIDANSNKVTGTIELPVKSNSFSILEIQPL